jgi:hypothetical protein
MENSVVTRLHAMLEDRHRLGVKTYGHPIDPSDGHDWKDEALAELLDALQYLMSQVCLLEMRLQRACVKTAALETALKEDE